ncbi:hypothetical protein BC939DRAFT_247436 [Gamsiella multidivaricata]|uniref:uncharacterized protein n=1 Tax=Gamsiella multidivaricata TaxID=101098 RepID=UPI0022207374|nr:uncharacterized protein BC939DRAFT_247436 [Gamsiella multidivaricata]KAG0366502.1 hypothetical protein BGZ54_005245 [Gamsiella multidivaricata]KAI7819771.1 hypothetical protein BC939DRAFT_247436 [Gamsiella multidivaricata]
MAYEYILIIAAILIPLGLFGILKGGPASELHLNQKKTTTPGAFGESTTSKSKKKKSKKKTGTIKESIITQISGNSAEKEQDSDDSGQGKKTTPQPARKTNALPENATKNSGNKDVAAQAASSSPKSLKPLDIQDASKNGTEQPTAPSSSGAGASVSKTTKAMSVESWKKVKQEQQKEQLAKQQEQLQFASAAAKNASWSPLDSSLHIASIPGPGAMGNNKKKNRGNAGSGLSHADFPSLARPQPSPAPTPKQPKLPKQKKEAEKKPDPLAELLPEPEPEAAQAQEENDSEEEQPDDDDTDASQDDNKQEEDEWKTVSSTQTRSGGIDFNKPMDPWVAQQQRQKLERVAVADPHGEQTERFARVLSIKPTVKEERIREAIPDGFTAQKSRTVGGSSGGGGSSQYQSTELTKKQRENMAKAAKRKEEKAAADAAQEQRRQEHMRQVKGEKMKEFYRAQTRKQTPVESRWDVPKASAPSSSAQASSKDQLIWD